MGVPLSRRCFRSSLVIRGTGTPQYCDRAVPAVSTCGWLARRCAVERNDPRAAGDDGRDDGWRGRRGGRRLGVDRPTRRALTAVDAPEEDLPRLAPHTV